MKVTCGADPELFLVDFAGVLRSSIGKIGGSKEMPRPLPIGQGYCVQEDNVAMEFNIPPAEGRDQFIASIDTTLAFLAESVKEMYGYGLSKESAASFLGEELDHPAALVFGCEPDFNAWTKDVNPKPKASDPNLRSCGGHVHVGFDINKVDQTEVIKMMDLHLGVPSVLMDTGDLRKQLYGKHGAFRPKSYGAEYRTLSNFWIFSNRLIGWVWDNTLRAVNAAESRLALSEEDGRNIALAIDGNDKALAWNLVNKYQLEVV